MFQEESGKPYLDMKHEYHVEYFETMGTILPGFSKVIERSFISEHMLFRVDIMRKLIEDIEKNDNIPGTRFWEKIINAIPEDKIQDSAFSEFETYGTYTALKFMNAYKLREWHSFRQGGNFFKIDTISDRDFTWLSKDFDAISFEKGHEVREDNANLFDNPYYQEKLTPKQMVQAAQLEYKDGYKEVWADDTNVANANTTNGSFISDEVVPESPLKYLDNDTYKIYEKLGDELADRNVNQAFLCYENAEFLCRNANECSEIISKRERLVDAGNVNVNKTAFIVLSYNNLYFTQRCIESIYTNCNPDSYLLVIFDNGSTDGSQEWLSKWGNEHDEALIILNDENLGFSLGNNAACLYIPGDYDIFYLNNDTRMPANALFWMRMALYSSDDIGGVGALQSYADADQLLDVKFNVPEQYVEFGASNNIPMDNPLEEQSKICGFAMLIRNKAYQETGGFDDRFNPGFLEDDDLSLHIRSLGYKLVVCHNSYIYHAGSQSFIKRRDTHEMFNRHREILKQKWGFDSTIYAAMSVNELAFINDIEKKGFNKDSRFKLLHIGCGCGNMLGRVHYMYPNADLYGIDADENARKFAISCINVYKDVDELPFGLSEFELIAKDLG
jgi:GT2 family glycosyltransferase